MLYIKYKHLICSVPKLINELFRKNTLLMENHLYHTIILWHHIFYIEKYCISGLHLQIIIYINIVCYALFLPATLIHFSSMFLLKNIM